MIRDAEGVLLVERQRGPCRGLWVLPGGTVRFGEGLDAAVRRIGRDELARVVRAGAMLGIIEYPSHLDR
ncbi:MAG TPA: NUDIX domain-containing protein, partial [Acidimicrobiales bacterium]|nr:NUDIX domain-containing protein [Acidimicrobiales bacterium]